MRRSLSVAVVMLLLTIQGCAPGMVSTREMAASPLSVEQFVEKRFLGYVMPYARDKQRTPDGGVIFDAYFNTVNYEQLHVPHQNLKTFCEAKAGKFVVIEQSRTAAARLATPGITAGDVFYGNLEYYRRIGFTGQLATLAAAYNADFYRQVLDIQYPPFARELIGEADREGRYGKFACEADGAPRWIAIIEPIRYMPIDPARMREFGGNNAGLAIYIKASRVRAP